MSEENPIFGDMFLHDGKIFRIWTNYHLEDHIIASPIYRVRGKRVERTEADCKKRFFGELPNSEIKRPMVRKDRIEEFYDCSKTGKQTDKEFFENFYRPVKKYLRDKGIDSIGLTGSGQLLSRGFKVDPSDLDIIVQGKKNSQRIAELGTSLFKETPIEGYTSNVDKILKRRKKTMPYKIDRETARIFESKKPIGRLRNRHVNITPTFKGEEEFYSPEISKENLGLITTEIKVEDAENAIKVPSTYKVKTKDDHDIDILRTTFFFYSLGTHIAGERFRVKGHLLKEKTSDGERKVLSLENWGNYEEYYMNIV